MKKTIGDLQQEQAENDTWDSIMEALNENVCGITEEKIKWRVIIIGVLE